MTSDATERFKTGGALQGHVGRLLFDGLATRQTVPPGTRIGAFEVGDEIGSGGMGTVYRAARVVGGFEQTVAIKLILATDAYTRERFRAEMEILAGLNHPNIAQLVDGGESEDGALYLAMEFVDGLPLDEYCDQHRLGANERLRLLLRIADALAHAHRNLVIHRDIKPNNILVHREEGRPKLLDFGIAKLFGTQKDRNLTVQNFGPMTPTYAAPEQFRGEPITVATDVYQFGVLMYRLLSGGLPYDTATDDPVAWARAVLEDDPLSLDKARMRRTSSITSETRTVGTRKQRHADRDLDAIVQMALMKDPNRRYGSMDALIADLEAFLDGRPVTARHGGNWYRMARFASRHRWAVIGSSLAIVGMAITTTVAVSQAIEAHNEAVRLKASVDLLNSVFKAADLSSGSGGKRSLEDLLDVAAKDVVERLNEHPDLRAGILLQVADVYASMGLPARSAPLYAQAIADLRAQSSFGLPFLQALDRGALASYWIGNFKQAYQWIDEATPLANGDNAAHAAVRDGLFFTRWQMLRTEGKFEECYEVAVASVRHAETVKGDTREDLLQRSLVRRGTSATDLQKYADAERDLLKAVEITRGRYGDNHSSTLKAQQALGWHYSSRGELARGLAILEPAGERVREVFGERSQEWARNLYNRANIYTATEGRWEDGLAAYLESAKVYREASSPNVSIGALYNAASLLRAHGRQREALPIYAEVEQIWIQSRDLRNPRFKRVYIDIAACNLEAGDVAAARKGFDQAQRLFDAHEREGGNYADLLVVGADIAKAEGAIAQAEDLLHAAINIVANDPERAGDLAEWQRRLDALR
jgi:serine/threonine protein kinase/tetratricopeptide (TPR) repeat protein